MSELKTTDYWISLAVKCATVKASSIEIDRLIACGDYETLDKIFKLLGAVLIK